jgi:ribosomal protein S18 acetylase RimI-like enzyme
MEWEIRTDGKARPMAATQRHDITFPMLERGRLAVERLRGACRAADGIDPPFFLDAPGGGQDAVTSFGVHDKGELIGFAHLPDDPEPEACAMVHPAARRHGIGRELVAAMSAESRRRGLPAFVLVNDAGSAAGAAFLSANGAGRLFSEYRLQRDRAVVDDSPRLHPNLVLVPAGPDATELLVRIRAAAFGDPIAATRDSIQRRLGEGNRRYFLGLLDGEPIGLLRTGAWSGFADVTSFGVLPRHQGRGYGRQMLLAAVDLLRREGWQRIQIEVETENDRALGLYRTCGFAVIAKFDYHRLPV